MAKEKNMVVFEASLVTEKGEKIIREWAGHRGPLTSVPEELLDATNEFYELEEFYGLPLRRVKELMGGGIPEDRVKLMIQTLAGNSRPDYAELRDGFRAETLCRFYRAMMHLRYQELGKSSLATLMDRRAFRSLKRKLVEVFTEFGISLPGETLFDIVLDGGIDEMLRLLDKSRLPNVGPADLTTSRSWHQLKPILAWLDDAGNVCDDGTSVNYKVGQSGGFQVRMVINPDKGTAK